jgi:Fe-S-cluster-containing dehydrogenase component/anaerobic selenocysteine-containing dehydrogenase
MIAKRMKKYWKSIEERFQQQDSPGEQPKPHEESLFEEMVGALTSVSGVNRRDFLKVSGFSLAAATLASCQGPVNKAIPFIIKPEEVTSGVANYYASSYIDGGNYCSIVVKTREGRPIKIEGNTLSSITRGGTSARVQASVLSLYDTARLQKPLHKNNPATWDQIDGNIVPLLQSFNSQGRKMAILSSSLVSPSTRKVLDDFQKEYPTTRIVHYDAISSSAILMANQKCFKRQVIPGYRFDKAQVIVSFGADFLGTWIAPETFTRQYVQNRKLNGKKTMSRHIQFETGMSLTGSNADKRIPILPSQEGILLVNLYQSLQRKAGKRVEEFHPANSDIESVATELWSNKGKSLVVSSTNDENIQILVNAINTELNNYGTTIDLNKPLNYRQGVDSEMERLVKDMNEGIVDALILHNVNPVYDYPESDNFVNGLKKLKLSISLSSLPNETTELCHYVCPDHHYLESWNDAEPQRGFFSLCQPTIHPLFGTRSAQESLLKWMGIETKFEDYLQSYWHEHIFPQHNKFKDKNFGLKKFWVKSLQDGIFEIDRDNDIVSAQPGFDAQSVIDATVKLTLPKSLKGKYELQLYESIAIGNGKNANNPWLQELPNPITKVCWDNIASIPPALAVEMDLENGDLVTISDGLKNISIPVLLQPGQALNTISIALGYGRTQAGKAGNNVGVNVAAMGILKNGTIQYHRDNISIDKLNGHRKLAITQTHHSMEGRAIVRETTLAEYLKNSSAGNEVHKKFIDEAVTLYKKPAKMGYHWSLSIDLNSCTGCGNCLIACQAENNVPVIGQEEVRKRRIMHWIRIDRYYSDSPESPQVYHQPVMCQHCDNAPCENVCPVAATSHSDDGLNHMTYNRCIGTRYCMNNCPYKVRRFNWFQFFENKEFDYYTNSDLGRMVLNPDVVVRSRGVAEKCSMCIQRIQEKKQQAKLENRRLVDDEIKPACLESCPADALVFGNRNDEDSKISMQFRDERNYGLLEEIHALPSVGYLVKVRNQLHEEVNNEDI